MIVSKTHFHSDAGAPCLYTCIRRSRPALITTLTPQAQVTEFISLTHYDVCDARLNACPSSRCLASLPAPILKGGGEITGQLIHPNGGR